MSLHSDVCFSHAGSLTTLRRSWILVVFLFFEGIAIFNLNFLRCTFLRSLRFKILQGCRGIFLCYWLLLSIVYIYKTYVNTRYMVSWCIMDIVSAFSGASFALVGLQLTRFEAHRADTTRGSCISILASKCRSTAGNLRSPRSWLSWFVWRDKEIQNRTE